MTESALASAGRRAIACGIDFGTSNSAIALAYDNDDIEVVRVDVGDLPEMLPSLVYLDRNRLRLSGTSASTQFMITGAQYTQCSRCPLVDRVNGVHTDCKQYVAGRGCSDARLLSGLKFEMAEPGFIGTNSWAADFPLPELIAEVLRPLKRAAEAQSGIALEAVSLGHPFVFHNAEGPEHSYRQRIAKDRLVEAAKMVGFLDCHLVPEPQAAALVEEADGGTVMTVDFGAGTFDVAIVDFDRDPAKVIALEGAPIGGELIDTAMYRRFVSPALGMDVTYRAQSGAQLGIPAYIVNSTSSMTALKGLMQERDVAVVLRDMAAAGADVPSLEALLYGGQAFRFYRSVEAAKIRLSSGEAETIIDLRTLDVAGDVRIDQTQFASIVDPLLAPVEAAIDRAMARAKVSPGDLAYVVRTGGSSQLPAFVQMLERKFTGARLQARDPFDTVVTGLAIDALGRWGE